MPLWVVLFLLLFPMQVGVSHKASKPYWDALKTIALKLEVVGPQEHWIDDFNSELHYVQRHLWRLVDAPMLGYAQFLPPSDYSRNYTCHLLQLSRNLELRQDICLWHREETQEVLREIRLSTDMWRIMDLAANENQSWVARRMCLRQLYEMGVFNYTGDE